MSVSFRVIFLRVRKGRESGPDAGAKIACAGFIFCHTILLYKNMFYKNVETEICEILRLF